MHPSAGEPPLTLYDTGGPYTDPRAVIDIKKGLERPRDAWVLARGDVEEVADPRPVRPEDNGNARGKHLAPQFTAGRRPFAPGPARRSPSWSTPAGASSPPEMEYVAIRENLRREADASVIRDGERLRGRDPRLRHPRVRPRRGGPRPGDHPGQHQPRRAGADGHRPQLPGQDQRQHRQFRRAVVGRGRGRQDGLGDPLGRRHDHGPVHRPQHPQHPRVDHPQLPDAARHRADLPGAGEGRRRRRGPDLGGVPRHPDRAGRAGGGLFHHPRRGAPALHPADRQAGHRHRLARRLDHGQVVPGPPPRELPLRPLRGHLRDHARLRRVVLAGRRPAPRLDRRRQRRGPVRRAGDPGRADQGGLEARRAGDDRRPRPRADAQDQGQHGQAAEGLPRGAVLYPGPADHRRRPRLRPHHLAPSARR